jgi:hypothetical protein
VRLFLGRKEVSFCNGKKIADDFDVMADLAPAEYLGKMKEFEKTQ